jgi:TolB-like protein/tetratricopeptide (TPR) repeat protein
MPPAALRFGRFELQPRQRRLLADGQAVPIGARAFDMLVALAEKPGELWSKDALLERVWPGVVVEENNLQVQVSALRKLLGSDTIATIPGHGYRFTAALQALAEADAPTPGVSLPQPPSQRPSLAILPFVNIGNAEDREYFGDGLAEGVIDSLSRSRWLFVVARNSSFNFRGPDVPIERVSRELGVRYVVTGSVRGAGERLRVAAQLADASSGATIWADRFDRRLDDLFAVQDEISSTIASTIEPEFLRREEDRARRADPQDLAQWTLLMRARWHFWRSTRNDLEEARRLLKLALDARPDDCACLTLLAFTHLADLWSGRTRDPRGLLQQTMALAMDAVRIDDRDASAHLTLGTTLSLVGKMDRARAELQRAVDLYPDYAAAQGELARLLAFSGEGEAALALVERCFVCSPGDPHLSLWRRSQAIACFVLGRHDAAVAHALQAVAMRPDWFFNHYLLAACKAAAGREHEAQEAMAEARRLMPHYAMDTLRAGHPFTRAEHFNAFVNALRSAGWDD